jgi:tetratricopeptide (TPR) repeat protein
LWADRFDKPMADPFDMQDEIVSQLANELRPELLVAEARRADSVADPDSMDLYFQGVQQFNKGGVGNIEAARGYFERAVALDPTNIDALVGAARADVLAGAIYTTEHRAERLAEAEALLIKGISIAPRNHWAHLWLAFIQIQTNRASRAIGELEQALSLNRNLGAAHAWIGQAKITMGRAEEAEAHVNEAFRLSPSDAVAFIWTHIRGLAKLHLGADEEAVALFRRSVDASRNYPLNHFYMAAALANLSRLHEAQAEVKAGLELAPNYSIARFLSMAESDNPTYLKQRERILEGLRLAGVPEK